MPPAQAPGWSICSLLYVCSIKGRSKVRCSAEQYPHLLDAHVDLLPVGGVGDDGCLRGADGDLARCAQLVQGGRLGLFRIAMTTYRNAVTTSIVTSEPVLSLLVL